MKITGKYVHDIYRAKLVLFTAFSGLLFGGTSLYFNWNEPLVSTEPSRSFAVKSKTSSSKKIKQDKEYLIKQTKIALIIGINDYTQDIESNTTKFSNLKGAVNDANRMGEFFKKQGYEVKLMTSTSTDLNKRPTRENILDTLENLGSVDRLAFYFAGHGYSTDPSSDNSEISIVPYRTTSKHDWITRKKIISKINHIRGLQDAIIIWDACQIGQPKDSENIQMGKNINWLWISATDIDTDAREFKDGNSWTGVFTQTFLEKLQTFDTQADGLIDAVDIEHLQNIRELRNKNLTPTVYHENHGIEQEDFIVFDVSVSMNHE